jgi:hypothetical protein
MRAFSIASAACCAKAVSASRSSGAYVRGCSWARHSSPTGARENSGVLTYVPRLETRQIDRDGRCTSSITTGRSDCSPVKDRWLHTFRQLVVSGERSFHVRSLSSSAITIRRDHTE